MRKLFRYEQGLTVISALEDLCDHVEHVLNKNVFCLEDIESLQQHVEGQYYSHKYDPRREEVLLQGTPQQKTALEQEEARADEMIDALKVASEKRFEEEQRKAKGDPAKLRKLDDWRRTNAAERRKRAERDRGMHELTAQIGA